jgi:hypothetical protein
MKKKLTLTILSILYFINNASSQIAIPSMIVHGTDATSFYLVDNGQIFHILADELWLQEPNPLGMGGIINSTNLSYTQVPVIPHEEAPADLYISCWEAKMYYISAACGPLFDINGNKYCMGTNSNACSIKFFSGGFFVTVMSSDGDF